MGQENTLTKLTSYARKLKQNIFVLKLIPPYIIEENREKAEEIRKNGKPKNWFVAVLFILIWILLVTWFGKLLYGIFH